MVTRLTVTLEQPEYSGLVKLAVGELRNPPDQLRFILRQQLATAGLLPEQDQAGQPAGGQGGQHGHQ